MKLNEQANLIDKQDKTIRMQNNKIDKQEEIIKKKDNFN